MKRPEPPIPVRPSRRVSASTPTSISANNRSDKSSEQLLLERLRAQHCWRGYIQTVERGLQEPWPIQVQVATDRREFEAFKLLNKGDLFLWQQEDGTVSAVAVKDLEEAIGLVIGRQSPVVLISHERSTDNLHLVVDIAGDDVRKETVLSIRAVYKEPQDGQEPDVLCYYIYAEVVEGSRFSIVQAPILEQNLYLPALLTIP